MMRRGLTLIVLLAMVAFGVGVYARLASFKTRGVVAASPNAPPRVSPKFRLPGTMFLAQGGSIYRLQDGLFRQIATGNWTQPVLSPDHSQLVAVARFADESDLYLLDLNGNIQRQLTHNASRVVDFNHWSFYPRFSPDGQTLFYSWDPKNQDNLYRVDRWPGHRAAPGHGPSPTSGPAGTSNRCRCAREASSTPSSTSAIRPTSPTRASGSPPERALWERP